MINTHVLCIYLNRPSYSLVSLSSICVTPMEAGFTCTDSPLDRALIHERYPTSEHSSFSEQIVSAVGVQCVDHLFGSLGTRELISVSITDGIV